MANCIIYNGEQYSEDQFANLLLNGELEKLAAQRRITTPITKFQQDIKDKINQINNLFNRKLGIEQTKYRAALNSSNDLIKIRKFYSKNPTRIDISNQDLIKELGLDRNTDVAKLKFELIQINKAFKATKAALISEKNMQLKIARGEPVVVKDKPSLTRMLRNLFNLKGTFKTTDGTVTQDVAAATIMDKVLQTIAKRQSIEQSRPIKISDIYKNLLFKKSTMEELLNPLNTIFEQSIQEEGITNLGIDFQQVQDVVEDLEDKGKTADEIFIQTKAEFGYGAYRGLDQKIYMEVKDNDVYFNTTVLPSEFINSLAKPTYLYNIIDHPELFAAYPELRHTIVYTKSFTNNRNRGFFALSNKQTKHPLTGELRDTPVIILNNKDINGEEIKNLSETLTTLLHEIQHNIQTIEGLHSGLSEDSFKELIIDNKRAMVDFVLPALEEAQEKGISLGELKQNDDAFWKEVYGNSIYMNTFDTMKVVTEDDINQADKFLYTLNNFTKGDTIKMYISQFEELQPEVTEIRARSTNEELDTISPATDILKLADKNQLTPTVGWEEPIVKVLQRRGYLDNLLYQMAGVRGIKYRGLSGQLEKAEQLQAAGASKENIKKETGFEQDSFNNWRYEFLDINDIEIPNFNKSKRLFVLEDLINSNSEIFKFYPDASDIVIDLINDPALTKKGSFNRNSERIVLNLHKLKTKEEILFTLVHELQHYIQLKEGLPSGSTIKKAGSFEKYFNAPGEVEARRVSDRLLLNYDEKRNSLFYIVKPRPIKKQIKFQNDTDTILNVFHGTSKDKDFKKFNNNNRGIFVTTSPKEAGAYAEDNDSMKYGDYNHITGTFNKINIASRIFPMSLDTGNIYKLTKEDFAFLNSSKSYAKTQNELHHRLRKEGYDTIDYGNGVYAIITENRLRSVLTGSLLNQDAKAAFQSSGQYSIGNANFSSLTEMQDIIHAITDPNVSSPLHEVAHKYERYLTNEERAEVLNSYNENNKTNETEWTRAVSEHFARGFEKYLQTGESPSRLLNNIFAAFKEWLTDIYKGILYQNIDIELNEQMKKIYANMIGEDYKIQLQEEVKLEIQNEPTPLSEIPPISSETISSSIQKQIIDAGLAGDLRSITSSRLIKEGLSQQDRTALIGTSNAPIITSSTTEDLNNLLQSYENSKDKQLKEFMEVGEGFNPSSGNMVNNDTSWWDSKISKIQDIINFQIATSPSIEETPIQEEPITQDNPYSTASQIEMSDSIRSKYNNLTSQELLDEINKGNIEVIPTTETSNLFILKGEVDPMFSEYGGTLEDAKETATLDKKNQDTTADSLIEQYKTIQEERKQKESEPLSEREENDLTRYKLSEEMYAAKNRISNSDNPEQAISEYTTAKKAYDDFNNMVDHKKDMKRIESVYIDSIKEDIAKEGSSHRFYDLYLQDPRLAVIAEEEDSIKYYEEVIAEGGDKYTTVEEAQNRIEAINKTIETVKYDIEINPIYENQQTADTTSTTTNGFNTGQEAQTPPIQNNPQAEVPEQITPQEAENLITPEVDEPIIINEEPKEEELPTPPPTEFDGFKVGDKVMLNGTERTIEAFKVIGKETFALVSNRLAGASNLVTVKTSKLNVPKKTKATIEKEETIEAAVIQANNRDFVINPPIEGETLVFEGKEGVIGYTKLGELYIKFPNKDVDFPNLSELSENSSTIEKKVKMKGEATVKKNMLYTVALRMHELFPSIKFEIGEYEGTWSGKFSKGKVYINARNADVSTPIHEFLHPFIFALREENQELFDNMIKALKTSGEYQTIKKEVEKSGEYDNSTPIEMDEEIVVRAMTPIIKRVINEDGTSNQSAIDAVTRKYGNVIREFIQTVLDYIRRFLGSFGTSFNSSNRSKKAGTYLEDLNTFEYNIDKGRLYVFGAEQEQPKLNVVVGKGKIINIEEALMELSKVFPKESSATFERVLDILQKKVTDSKEEQPLLSTNDPEVQALFGGLTASGIKKSDVTFDTVDATFLQTVDPNTTLEQIGSMVSMHGLYAISLDKYQKTFETLSDKLYVKTKEDLTDFATKFKKRLLNLKHTLESRLKSTGITHEMEQRIMADLRAIKPILEQTVTDDNYVALATDLVSSGFTSLYVADQLMSKIRSKIKVGDINNYINELERHLIAAGIKIEYKPNNQRAIRIHNGVFELNKARLLKDGYIPHDISKYISGKAHSKEDTRKAIQKIQTKVLNAIKVDLTQEEIQELNWEIMALRNYYATFKGFSQPLLTEYLDKLDHAEAMEFSDTLQRSARRMSELEGHMRTLSVDWLYPYFDDLQKTALEGMSKENYDAAYKTKEQFANLLRYANEDNGALDHLFGTIVNSKDPINATVSQIIARKITNNENILGHLVSDVFDMREKYFDPKGIKGEKERAQYIKDNFLRKVKAKEEIRDEFNNLVLINNQVQYKYTERWAFHTEYLEDEYAIALEAFKNSIQEPSAPIGGDKSDWDVYNFEKEEYRKKVKEWEDTSKAKFLNPKFATLMKDEMFLFLYTKYEQANNNYGAAKLKMGIIPQAFKQDTFIAKQKSKIQRIKDFIKQARDGKVDVKNKIAGSIKAATNYLISAEDKVYYEQANPDETIYRSIKTRFLRLLEEDEINFDITDTITAFTEDTLKYSSLRDIQANIENLRLLINGYAADGIGIKGRKVPQLDKDGNMIWHSKANQPKAKADFENRLNIQLNQFIDDIFYGDKVKEKVIRLWSSPKYKQMLLKANEMVRDGNTVEEIYNATTFYKDEQGRWQTDVHQNVNINLNKIAKNLTLYTSVNSLAFNVMSTARNLGIGNFMNLSEGYGGKYYNITDYRKAQGIYLANISQNAQDMVSNKKGKLNQILFNFQAIQGEFRDRYNKITTDRSAIARLFSTDSLFFLQHVAEHQIQGSATIALMLATKVKTKEGTEVSLWDAYELNEHKTLQLKDNIDKSSFNEGKFINTLHGMNRSNHGNYSDLHKTVIQREWYGTLFMTFRKHMYPTLKARWGKRQIDYSKGAEIEGFHRLFFRKISNDLLTYGMNITKYESFSKDKTGKGWTAEEVYGFRRSLFETMIGMVGMMVLTFILAGGDDDDEDSTTKKWLMAVTNGLYSDLAVTNPLGIFNPFTLQSEVYNEAKKMLSNPVAVQFTYKKLADFFTTMIDSDKDAQDRWDKAEKIIPIIRHTEAFTNPDDYVQGYLQYASLIGEGAIK